MRIVLIFLLGLYSCGVKDKKSFTTISINNKVLIEKIAKFIEIHEKNQKVNDIIISSQIATDTTIFYLIGDRKPNFQKNRVLGCTYINNVLVWLQGNEPDDGFVSIKKPISDNQVEVDMVKGENEIFLGHPLQWTIKFKGSNLISCKSNRGEGCQ